MTLSVDKTNIQSYKDFSINSLGYEFNNINLFIEALTHSSYANENTDSGAKDNERLEFLGDAILETIISKILYLDDTNFSEGDMTRIRSLTVREETLAEIARELKLTDYLLLGQGEEKTGGRDKPSNAEDAMEAVIGAIFIDSNLVEAEKFVERAFSDKLAEAKSGALIYDYKSKLYRILQARESLPKVEFKLLEESGPAHDKSFTIAVVYKNKTYPNATANSKKLAEQEAARLFLENYKEEGY